MPRISKTVKSIFQFFGFELKRVRPKMSSGESMYSNFQEQQVIDDILNHLGKVNHSCVDIGAGDGAHMSNTYFLFKRKWKGLLIETDNELFTKLAYRYKNLTDVIFTNNKVSPDNILPLLEGAAIPKKFGFLNLDIDSYDYFVLDKILDKYRPSLCCIGINEKIPPPVKFTVKYYPNHQWSKDHFMGHSISLLEELCELKDYVLVKLHYSTVKSFSKPT